ncbi:MAG: D-glycero-beta-D-manno-heptose 1-phosphate adenylyltransferase [Flavobacteriales bacterium]|nr:D-glycero-beta-D-manno-heptose 1-phosphate adenylyltransferase [Bacteroidales bacterium AH-315-I05]PCJ89694.1 MAG: D-glycero-beta-D-manno-heptose 1-phosphate adenylyltransferase [Flavobacteriales bacterium]
MGNFEITNSKIFELDKLLFALNKWRNENQKIVFTNGCFDILHYGHINYLAKAADLGDKLVIGLNSDASVKLLDKGPNRPLQNEKSRATILAALHFVDAVVLFEDETPYNLINATQPDVLVKGGDWQPEDIIGHDIVAAKGGQILSIDFVKGYSTTEIEERIRKS